MPFDLRSYNIVNCPQQTHRRHERIFCTSCQPGMFLAPITINNHKACGQRTLLWDTIYVYIVLNIYGLYIVWGGRLVAKQFIDRLVLWRDRSYGMSESAVRLAYTYIKCGLYGRIMCNLLHTHTHTGWPNCFDIITSNMQIELRRISIILWVLAFYMKFSNILIINLQKSCQ